MKDSVPLSPLKPSAAPTDTEQQSAEGGNSALNNDLQLPHVSTETSNLRPQAPKAEDEVEEDDDVSGALTISELVYRYCTQGLTTSLLRLAVSASVALFSNSAGTCCQTG